MAVTSRIPLEFIAVVGVLLVTIAIVEVPRSNMAPPAASALDSQTWRVPESEPTDAAPTAGSASERSERRIAQLEASLEQAARQLARQRVKLARMQAVLDALREDPGSD